MKLLFWYFLIWDCSLSAHSHWEFRARSLIEALLSPHWLQTLVSQYQLSITDEIKREREFYRARGLPCPKDVLSNPGDLEEEKQTADAHAESDYHRADEQVRRVLPPSKLFRDRFFDQCFLVLRSTCVWNV